MNTSNIITWIISIAALGLASYSLYLQRKDRRPRLNINVETSSDDSHTDGLVPVVTSTLVIHAANPTDKPISIENILFKVEHYPPILAPLSQTIGTIPPHEKRQATVVVSQLREELGIARSGNFILIDALSNKHRSEAVFI